MSNLKKLKDPKRNHLIYGVADMVTGIGESLWGSILEPYLDFIGFGAVTMGFLRTLLMFSQMLASLLLGGLSDKIGRRGPIIFSFAVSACASLILGYTRNFWLFAILIFVIGFMNGLRKPSIMAAVAESTPKSGRGAAIGVFQLLIFTPLLFGSMFGGMVASFFGYQWIFTIHSGMAFLSTVIVILLSVEVGRVFSGGASSLRTAGLVAFESLPNTYGFLKQYRSYAFLMVAFAVHGFSFYIGATFWALYAKKGLLLAIASVGMIQTVRYIGLWLGAVPAGKLTDKIGGWAMIAIHIVLTSPTTILHVLMSSYEMALVNSFVYGMVGAFDGPARPVVYSKMVGEENMGIATGITDTFIMLGRMGGPIVAGVIWSSMGNTMPFWISGIINMFSLIPLFISWRLDKTT